MSTSTRWSLIAVGGVLFVLIAPMALIMGSNLVGGVLDEILNRKPTIAEFTGDYKLEVPWGRSMLHIRADGAFQQEIEAKGELTRVISGQWQARDGSNYLTVNFRPFGMVGTRTMREKQISTVLTSTSRIWERPTASSTTI